MIIERHNFAKDRIANDETIEHYINRIKKSYLRIIEGQEINLYYLKETPLNIAKNHILNSSKKDVFKNLKLTLNMGLGHFRRVLNEGSIEIDLEGVVFNLSSIEEVHGTSYFDWFLLYSITNILRSKVNFNELINMDLSGVNKIPSPFWFNMYQYLKGIEEKNMKVLKESLNGIQKVLNDGLVLFIRNEGDNKLINNDEANRILKILWQPLIELYDHCFHGRTQDFNKSLESYIVNKKEYIIKNKLENDPRYWIDFYLLGCLAYAHDSGIGIQVETEYAPKWVYERK